MTKSKMIKFCALAVALCILLPLLVYAKYESSVTDPPYDQAFDLNGDGKIDIKDIAMEVAHFGEYTTPLFAPPNFTNCVPASQYWMTGGDDPNPLYRGADNFYVSLIPGAPSSWPSTTYSVLLAHTDDWVVYEIITSKAGYLSGINLTLRNLLNPPTGLPPGYPPYTPIHLYVYNGTYSTIPVLSHDADINASSPSPSQPNDFVWFVGYSIGFPLGWNWYYSGIPPAIQTSLGTRNRFYIGVRLDNGTNYRPTYPYDRNVEIGWIQLYVRLPG